MDDDARRARLDSLTRRARALRDPGPALADEVDELRDQMTALSLGLAAAWQAAGTETPRQKPDLRLIQGGAA